MKVLVEAWSKHGATLEIADVIASELRSRGIDVVRATPAPIDSDVASFDAVVLGSAVYVGRWLPAGRAFVEANREALSAIPVWLFSSGPLGDPSLPAEDSPDTVQLAERVGARDHVVFRGSLDRDALGVVERATVRMVHAPYGDYREWDRVRAWAHQIADALVSGTAAVAGLHEEDPHPQSGTR